MEETAEDIRRKVENKKRRLREDIRRARAEIKAKEREELMLADTLKMYALMSKKTKK